MGIVNWKNIDKKWENQCVSVTNVYTLTAHPSYKDAKKNGSLFHAKNVVESIVKDREEYKRLADYKDATLIPIMGSDKENSKNQLPIALAEKLSEMSGMPVDLSFYKKNLQHNTDATWEDRVLSNDHWQGNVKKGNNYILVDDVFTSGMTLNSLKNYIEDNGGKVIAVTSLAASRYGKQLGVTDEQLSSLRHIDKEESNGLLEESYKKYKYKDGFEGMSHYEAKFQIESKKLRRKTISFYSILAQKEEALKQQMLSSAKQESAVDKQNIDYNKLDLNGAISISKEKILENNHKLETIFAQSAGKRTDLTNEFSPDSATIKIPWFINKEAREILKEYANILGGTYTNIRLREEVDGKVNWKTAAQIEFSNDTAKIHPAICAKIILGESVDNIIEAIDNAEKKTLKEEVKPSLNKEESSYTKEAMSSKFPDLKEIEALKEKYSNTIILVQDNDYKKVYGEDAEILKKLNMEEIKMSKIPYPSDYPKAMSSEGKENHLDVAEFHHTTSDKIFSKLVELNYRIAIIDFKEYKQETSIKHPAKKGLGI